MIDRFSKDEFENVLEEICNELGLTLQAPLFERGEWTYSIIVDTKTFIFIRSSVGWDFFANENGEDSIRLMLGAFNQGIIGKDAARWITRIDGWNKRLYNAVKNLQEFRLKAGDCKICNRPLHIYKVKKVGVNKGRLFAKCPTHNNFTWLTEAKGS